MAGYAYTFNPRTFTQVQTVAVCKQRVACADLMYARTGYLLAMIEKSISHLSDYITYIYNIHKYMHHPYIIKVSDV